MSDVIPLFAFNGHQLRGVRIDSEPWFFGADAVAILGIDNPGNAYRRLDSDERSNIRRTDVGLPPGRDLVVVSRPGLFRLIQRSDKPEAREFDRWVRHEVLPQLMDNGGYVMPDADMAAVAEGTRGDAGRAVSGHSSLQTCSCCVLMLACSDSPPQPSPPCSSQRLPGPGWGLVSVMSA